MKKVVYFSFALIAFGAVSCKKDYTCLCNYKTTQAVYDAEGEPFTTPQTGTSSNTKIINGKKDEAETKCAENNGSSVTSYSQDGYTFEQTIDTQCSID